MPIPHFQSNFTKKKIGDNIPQFAHKPITDGIKAKKKVFSGRFLYKKGSGPKKSNGSGWIRKLFKRFWPHILGLIFLGGIVFIGMVAWYSRDLPEPGKLLDRSVALSTKIYDRTGEVLLYEVHGAENRTQVSITEIPDYVKNATIAMEDKNFYDHQGISVWGIIRGQIVPRLQGRRSQGGSTLTQQFVKNAILTDERKISRKIKEWILSYRLEQKFSKDQILEFYFNEIPYGGAVYGVEAASQYYFDKHVQELTLAEAAILAALPQAPTLYSPYGNNRDLLTGRQQYILDLMVDQGYITKDEAEAAKNQGLVFKKRAEQIKAPHFVMYVRELLEQKYGASLVQQSGWEIKTSLDWSAQQKAEAAINEIAPRNSENYNASNAALVSLDTESAQILAMVGSKNYFDDEIDGQVNVVVSDRQPGSSLKPLVYLKAFEKGYRPDTILYDVLTNFASSGDKYEPRNYDQVQHGPVSIKQALAGSLNIPAVKALYLAGVRNVTDLAADFGYTTLTDPDRYGLSLVLGGAEVKLLEHTNGYATFAREGVYKNTIAVLEIKDSKGKIIEENGEEKGRRVIDKEYVRMLNDILSDNAARAYVFGESNYLTLPDRSVAAKTGTTNDYRDAWTIGFTPQIATGVWVGNNNNTEMKQGASGSVVAAPIWNKFMREVTAGMEVKDFKKQELNSCSKPMVCGKLSGAEPVEIDNMSGKLATEYTPYTTREKKNFLETHSILYYVNINDPLGDPLDDPNNEPQFNLWEGPILAWAEEQGFESERAPTVYDDIHRPELRPSISWVSPSQNQNINEAVFNMQVDADAPRGISRVEFFLDDNLVGKVYDSPYNLNYQVNPFVSNGQHALKAIAFDDLDNFKETSMNIDINLDAADRQFNLVWISPANGANLKLSNAPYTLELNIDQPTQVKKIDFYYLDPENQSHWFTYIENPYQNNLSVVWDKDLGPGIYKLFMVVKDLSDRLITTPGIIVNLEE
ncbi:PBP1A family penicillin-binding protein [Patescibacteria group bacterium]|nr:PBP1A family penicillin-binding protein [Patescibacteria group bacterium]